VIGPVTLILIAAGLAMDAFAAAMAVSVRLVPLTRRHIFRLAFHLGLFQALMPLAGWALGRSVRGLIESWDHWVAFGLLALIGSRAVREALRTADGDPPVQFRDPTRGWSLLILSVATSIDALAVGVGFAMLHVDIVAAVLVIGLVTSSLTAAGMVLGSRLGPALGRRMEIVGGLLLITIGTKILAEHLTAV